MNVDRIPPGSTPPPSEPSRNTPYTFVQLDPRPGATNPSYGFGIEISDSRLLLPGVTNLDHHGEDSTIETPSACEQALTVELPPEGTTVAGLKMDKDTVAAMAILESRRAGRVIDVGLVRAVSAVDRRGIQIIGQYAEYQDLILALDRKAVETKLPLAERVKFAQSVLDGTVSMTEVKQMVEARNREFEQAQAESKIIEIIPDKLVLVESFHRYATNLGYEVASTIVAFNPQMPVMKGGQPTEETYAKFTIARYDDHVPTDITAILQDLRQAEADARSVSAGELTNNWGGRGDIIGSPQNESSKLTVDQVVQIVKAHIPEGEWDEQIFTDIKDNIDLSGRLTWPRPQRTLIEIEGKETNLTPPKITIDIRTDTVDAELVQEEGAYTVFALHSNGKRTIYDHGFYDAATNEIVGEGRPLSQWNYKEEVLSKNGKFSREDDRRLAQFESMEKVTVRTLKAPDKQTPL